MTESQMASWVQKNCKFAQMQPQPMRPVQPQPMPQQKLLSQQQVNQLISSVIPKLQGIVKQDPNPAANFNAVQKQVQMALQSAANQMGGLIQNLPSVVKEVMDGLGIQQPVQQTPQQPGMQQQVKPMVSGPVGWEPPGMSQMRNRPKQ